MNAKLFDAAVRRAVDVSIKKTSKVCDMRMYVFVGTLIGALESVDASLAAKVQSLMNDAGVVDGRPQ